MSLVFANVNILTEAEHDKECSSPSKFVRPASTYSLRPKLDSLADDDPDMKSKNTKSKENSLTAPWTPEPTSRVKAQKQAKSLSNRKLQVNLKKELRMKVGAHVSSCNPDISPNLLKPGPHRQRSSRPSIHGVVLKRSDFQPRFWLVEFLNGKRFYCTVNILKFEDKKAPTHILSADAKNKLVLKSVDATKKVPMQSIQDNKGEREMDTLRKQQEAMLRVILYAKVQKIPGHPNLTYRSIYEVFKPQFSWLTLPKLKYYGRKMLHNNDYGKNKESWIAFFHREEEAKKLKAYADKKVNEDNVKVHIPAMNKDSKPSNFESAVKNRDKSDEEPTDEEVVKSMMQMGPDRPVLGRYKRVMERLYGSGNLSLSSSSSEDEEEGLTSTKKVTNDTNVLENNGMYQC